MQLEQNSFRKVVNLIFFKLFNYIQIRITTETNTDYKLSYLNNNKKIKAN